MNVEQYFNTEVEFEEFIKDDDNKTLAQSYNEAIKIKVRIEGKTRYIRNDYNQMTVSEQSFMTVHPVKVKDRINGQYVVAVAPIYDFDGSLIYYEAFV